MIEPNLVPVRFVPRMGASRPDLGVLHKSMLCSRALLIGAFILHATLVINVRSHNRNMYLFSAPEHS